MSFFYFLRLQNVPIFDQLQIEEALLRANEDNWCIVNEGSNRSIVVGVSGKEHELVDLQKARDASIPLIRRFSGGGTVIVDEHTLFASFICQKDLHPFQAYPEPILSWTAAFYKKAFAIESFDLKAQDYALDNLKCAGNAQYLKKDRWLHHTTFLWDFKDENMDFLLMPKKTPEYRKNRNHLEFLCRLKSHLPTLSACSDSILKELKSRYLVKEVSLEEVGEYLTLPHRKTTQFIAT